jgi:hypothetical protein
VLWGDWGEDDEIERERERESRLEFGSVGAEEAAPKTSEKDKQMIGPPSLPIHFLTRARGDSLVWAQ